MDEEHRTPAEIAKEAGVKDRTVLEAIGRAGARRDVRLARQQHLVTLIEQHQQDLLAEASRLREATDWPPKDVQPSGGMQAKRYAALLAHEKRLQRHVRLWKDLVRGHDALEAKIDDAIKAKIGECDLEGLGGAYLRLVNVAKDVGRGRVSTYPPWSVVSGQLWCGPDHIVEGVSSLDDQRATAVRRNLDRLVKEVSQWEDVVALKKLHSKWKSVRASFVNDLEDIEVRHQLDGHCRWCPGAQTKP